MKISIRNRLFMTVSLLIAFFVIASWLMNSNYLEKYYISQNKRNLLDIAERIDQLYNGSPQDISLELQKLERTSGLNIIIWDKNFHTKYRPRGIDKAIPSKNEHFAPDPFRGPERGIILIIRYKQRILAGDKVLAVSQDPKLNTDFLNVVSLLNNGDYLLVSTPLMAIHESAIIANRFFLFTGLLTILIGSIAVYFFAKRFTRPILELNSIAQKMAELDFSQKYQIETGDELGDLGKSINSLSDQLDKSITELTEANAKLLKDIEHERRIDEMRKEFVSSVSHELKTPIALIQGYAEGLKENVVEDEDSKNYYCYVIADEASKMNKMVRELLDLSQIESGYFKLERQVFDISMLVEQVLNKFDPILKEKQICLTGERGDEILVNGDIFRIEQVLVNYLNNALNHIDKQKEIAVNIHPVNDKVRISIFNTGIPIPDESLDKVFTSFYKVDKARTRAYGGTGLGLSVVRAIQEQHHNAYGVINRDNGVEFWFNIDRAT
ncbi:MAG: ATP-binding protein [Syntrophomonas sp.]